MNQRRKQLGKERGLRQKIEDLKTKHRDWDAAQRKLLRQEKERFETELEHLEKELQKTLRAEKDMEDMEDIDDLDAPTDTQSEMAALEQRALNAERVAWESQQAVLAMHASMQQLAAFQQNAAPAASTAPPPEPWTMSSPSVRQGMPGPFETSSPLIPKSVRNGTLKKSPPPKTSKATERKEIKPKENKEPKETAEVVDLEKVEDMPSL